MAYAAYNRGIARAASSKLWEAGLDFSFVIDILKSARVKIQLEGRVLQLFSAAFVNRAVVNHWLVNKAAECVKDVEEAASLEKRYADRKIRKADGDSLWGSIARENRLASVTVAESVLATSRVPQNRVLLLLLQRATFLRHIERNLEAAGACAAALAAQKQMQAVATAEQVAVILNSLAVSLYQFSKSKNGRDAAPPNKEKSKSVPSISPSCAMRHWSKLIRSAARGDRSLDEASASHLAKRALLCAIHARPDRARPRFNLSAILGRSKTGDTQLRSAKIVEIDHVPCRYVLAANSCDDGLPGEAEHELFHALGSVSYAQNSKLYPRELTADRVAACAAASKANISLNLAVLHQFCGENSAAENRYAKIEDLSPLLADTHARVLAIASWARASNALARYAAASHDEEFLVTARTESNRSLNEPAAIDDCLLATFHATSALSSIARHDFDDANKKLQFASDLVDATGADSLPPWLKAQSVAAIVWANRASAMMGIGNADHRDQTIDLLNKTLAHLPRYSNLHRQLANSLHLANKFLLAMSALNCALAIQTNTAEEDVKPT